MYHHLKSVIKSKFGLDATAVGDEGGFAPNILNNKDALILIQVRLGLSTVRQFYRSGRMSKTKSMPNQWNVD